MTFLKLLSATAKQTFTYHCLNSAAWLHSASHSHEYALRFRGSNGDELTHENTHYIIALYDGCQVSKADILRSVRSTVFSWRHLHLVNTQYILFNSIFQCLECNEDEIRQENKENMIIGTKRNDKSKKKSVE
uniref:Fibrillar collagen NC1 domain-containing protein n=1 Tax=Monopterus albus TaxID=43700 RepID=A0A3Q3K315_MONAL